MAAAPKKSSPPRVGPMGAKKNNGGGRGKSAGSNNRDRRNGQVAIQIGPNNGNANDTAPKKRGKIMRRMEKPRQEICAPLKWACFIINFIIFLASVACLALGLYLYVNDPRPVAELADFFLNPAVLFASVGLISGCVVLFGLFGALRDNVFLLKLFALCVFLAYLLLVIGTCLLFLLFYSDATGETTGISAQSLLLHSISRYNSNKNVADFVDYLQEQMECCGSTTFRDWQFSEQFNCNGTNPYPERCGVPFSCCRRSVVSGAGSGAAGQNPLAPAIRSIQCWQNAQKKREQELDSEIYVAGCLQPLRALFDAHALHIGMAVVAIIVPVCLGVCLSQCLARQIDYQHFLLHREQRRIERRERRERRYIEQMVAEQKVKQRKKASISSQSGLIERVGEMGPVQAEPIGEQRRRRSPPKVPPPPTPRNDAEAAALAAAIKASKLEWEEHNRRLKAQQPQSRAASFSPLRNVAVKKAKDEANKNGNKRKSMTIDSAEQQTHWKMAVGKKEAKQKHDRREDPKTRGPNEKPQKPSPKQQQQQHPIQRQEPTAPPIFLALQPHHFK